MRHPSRPRSSDLTTLGPVARHLSMLTLACNRCPRRGRLSTARLLAEWDEHAAMADIADALSADCPKRGLRSVYERCMGPHWPDLSGLFARPDSGSGEQANGKPM